MDNRGFPPGHPRAALHRNRGGTLTRDQFAEDSLLLGLFMEDALTDFVRRLLGFDTLYRCADPWLSLEVHVEGEGDQLAWHFDTNDGVVSLMLQAPDSGGEFEYAPYIRDEDDESYDEIAQVFAGTSARTSCPPIRPGTFALFRGRRSIHRVRPIGPTSKPRLMALLSYDRRPGMVFPEATVRSVIGADNEAHTGSNAA
jgi:hypothetical protein